MTIQLQGRLPPLERPTYFPQWVLVESSRGRQPPLPAAARLLMASYPTFQRSLTELLPNSNQYAFFASLLTYPPNLFWPPYCVQRLGASQISRADPPLHPAAICSGVAASRMGATGRVGGDLATSPSPPRGRRRGLAVAIPRAGTAPTAPEGPPLPPRRRRPPPHLTGVPPHPAHGVACENVRLPAPPLYLSRVSWGRSCGEHTHLPRAPAGLWSTTGRPRPLPSPPTAPFPPARPCPDGDRGCTGPRRATPADPTVTKFFSACGALFQWPWPAHVVPARWSWARLNFGRASRPHLPTDRCPNARVCRTWSPGARGRFGHQTLRRSRSARRCPEAGGPGPLLRAVSRRRRGGSLPNAVSRAKTCRRGRGRIWGRTCAGQRWLPGGCPDPDRVLTATVRSILGLSDRCPNETAGSTWSSEAWERFGQCSDARPWRDGPCPVAAC